MCNDLSKKIEEMRRELHKIYNLELGEEVIRKSQELDKLLNKFSSLDGK